MSLIGAEFYADMLAQHREQRYASPAFQQRVSLSQSQRLAARRATKKAGVATPFQRPPVRVELPW